MSGLLRSIAVLILACWPAFSAGAQAHSVHQLTELVPGGETLTYADLVRLIVPDLAASGNVHKGGAPAGVRHITGDELDDLAPETTRVSRVSALPLGAYSRLALLADLGGREHSIERFVVLALFDLSAEPVLLDAANVSFDSSTSFGEPAGVPVGRDAHMLVTASAHFNSSQGYAVAALVLARENRLELVDTISTFDDRGCAYDRSQRLRVTAGKGEPYADIVATVIEETVATGENCGDDEAPSPGTREITVTYRWDAAAARYRPDSDAFVVLAAENEKRF